MEEKDVQNISTALQEGLNLLLYKNQFGLIETSIITQFESFPYETLTSVQMPTADEALLALDEAHEKKLGILSNFYSKPMQDKINPIHAWLLESGNILGRFMDGYYVFEARRHWDNRTVESSRNREFVQTYRRLNDLINKMSFQRANDPDYMFNW